MWCHRFSKGAIRLTRRHLRSRFSPTTNHFSSGKERNPQRLTHPEVEFVLKGSAFHSHIPELVAAENLIQNNALVLYYFTSMDCHPCRLFDNKLKRVYSEAVSRNLDLLIVVVSDDDDRESMMEGLKSNYPEWYAIPYEDDLRRILRYNYGVTHIPHLIVVKKTGEIVTKKGRAEIENIGINVLITWRE